MKVAALGLSLVLLLGACNTATPTSDINTPESPESNPAGIQEENTGGESITGNLRQLLGMDRSMQCTFSSSDENGSVNGTVYVNGDNFRLISTSNDSKTGTNVESHMLSDAEWMYMWSNNTPQGVKMNRQTVEDVAENVQEGMESEAPSEALESFNQEVDYNCSPWDVDPSMFEVPDMTFTDMSAFMQGFQPGN